MTISFQSTSPFLLIDAGNTFVKWALTEANVVHFAQQGIFAQSPTCKHQVPAEPDWSALPAPGGVWMSNVAGVRSAQRIESLIRACWPDIPCHVIHAQASQCGVRNGYRDSQQLGSDRWASLIGARFIWPDEAMLIVTLGTAMTLDLLDADGYFTGGLIAPGGYLMRHALSGHTASLPMPELEGEGARAVDTCFATDTQTGLRTGCWLAQVALVEHIWHAAHRRLNRPVRCVLSGGGAASIRPLLTIDTTYYERLTLLGLARIAQKHALASASADTAQ